MAGRSDLLVEVGLLGATRVADDWLELTTEVPFTRFPEPWAEQWLRFNACLDGPVRAAFAPRSRTMQLRADLSVEEGGFDARVRSASEELRAALHLLENGDAERGFTPRQKAGGEGPPYDRETSNGSITDEISRLCVEAGWPSSSQATGGVRLDLETRAGLFSARFESPHPESGRWVVELMDFAPCSSATREATAIFLLSLSGAVKSVKSVLVERDDALVGAFVSHVEHPFLAPAFDRALSALAVACQLGGREVQALRDERLAAEYLALWSANRECESTMKEEHTCLQQL